MGLAHHERWIKEQVGRAHPTGIKKISTILVEPYEIPIKIFGLYNLRCGRRNLLVQKRGFSLLKQFCQNAGCLGVIQHSHINNSSKGIPAWVF